MNKKMIRMQMEGDKTAIGQSSSKVNGLRRKQMYQEKEVAHEEGENIL